MSKKERILVAMSGGLDSSAAAFMLHEQNYEVIGVYMKLWNYVSEQHLGLTEITDNDNEFKYAKLVTDKLGIPLYIVDLRKDFDKIVISNFVEEYISGKTPNPCVLCNVQIKWAELIEKAEQLNCDYIATGHYAQINLKNNRYFISKAVDISKDQSYMLWRLSQEYLKKTIFPLGNFHKTQVREIALKNGFIDLARKKESFEICFIPDNDYRGFLKRRIPGLEKKYYEGNFVSTDGKILGKHKGFPFYTIGQRRGLEIAVGKPMYVIKIYPQTNTIVLGTKEELKQKEMKVKNYNLQKYSSISDNFEVLTKVRYRDKGTLSTIKINEDYINVNFKDDVSAIAPGQSAVFYEGDDLVGGGIIV